MSDQKTPSKRLTLGASSNKDAAMPATTADGQKNQMTLHSKIRAGQITQNIGRGKSHQVAVEIKKTRKVDLESKAPSQTGNATAQQISATVDTQKEQDRDKTRQLLADAEEWLQKSPAHGDNLNKLLQQKEQDRLAEQHRLEEEAKPTAPESTTESTAEADAAVNITTEASTERKNKRGQIHEAPKEESSDSGRDDKKSNRREGEKRAPSGRGRDEPRRRQGKLTLVQALGDDGEPSRVRSLASIKRARDKERKKLTDSGVAERKAREVILPETISVGDLAGRMAERAGNVIKSLMNIGIVASQSQIIDADTAELIIEEFGHTVKRVSESDVEDILNIEQITEGLTMQARPPVVTIMGHVDHGKTSLLDRLRKTNVVAGEQGSITQHIGAYQIEWKNGQKITFLDTPGHAAFSAMRSRGADLTDIIVLVIAADDGVQPQTAEAIQHAKAAKVPIIVAINKCDHPEADPTRIANELLRHEIVLESLGGDVQAFEISALKGTNLDALIDGILLQAEIMEIEAPIDGLARGIVIETRQERGRGAVISVLLQSGTLKQGDIFVSGCENGRIRAISDDNGKKQKTARPGQPVEIIGAQGIPYAGDDFAIVTSSAQANEICDYRKRKRQDLQAVKVKRGSLDQLFSQIKDGATQDLSIILKADTHGSLEAISAACEKMSTDEVRINIALGAVGGISESDITLAETVSGFVIGFNVRANAAARENAQATSIDVRYYGIIYELLEDLRAMLSSMLKPAKREEQIGYAQVREVFEIGKKGKAAGCIVTEGILRRSSKVRLLRDDVVIYDGELRQLRRFKDEVSEVSNGLECGMSLDKYSDIRPNDMVECYEIIETAREITL